MTRRRSPEAQVVEFFQVAEPAQALTVFRIVRAMLETRGVFRAEVTARATRAKRPPLVEGIKIEASKG